MRKLNFESLISTVDKNAYELSKKMNLKSSALIINQQVSNYYNEYELEEYIIREFGFNERGIGLSRNTALMRSKADICLMADDDMIYVDDYLEKIEKEYRNNPDADMIIFNVRVHDSSGVIEKVKKSGRVNYFNSLKYGTVSFTFKREKILKNNIFFSLLFGGGAKFSNGEDSIFLWDCLKKGLNVYSSTEIIADVYNFQSSWFTGYNEKFFLDRGSLFEALSPKFSLLLIYQYVIRKYPIFRNYYSRAEAISLMKKGRTRYKKL